MGWQLIQAYNVGDGITAAPAASITFSSIPQTYKSLKLTSSARVDATGANNKITFNGVTTSVSSRYLYGTGSGAGSSSNAGIIYSVQNGSAYAVNSFGSMDIIVPNYSSTTANKPVSIDAVTEDNATGAYQYLTAGLYAANTAITSVTVTPDSGNFVFGSTFQLYGLI